jgi:predicted enzyme related to lactoylglutathione lyase
MARVVHFEIHAENPQRAVKFYQEFLGWDLTRWEGPMDYWLIRTGSADRPGIDGGLLQRRGSAPAEGQPVNAFVCTVDVEDLNGLLSRLEQLGGSLALPRMPVPGIGWLAYVKDTEGNILGLMQSDPTAA